MSKMTKKQQAAALLRVQIVEEAMALINEGKLRVVPSEYWSSCYDEIDQELINAAGFECQVCQVSALLMAAIGLFDKHSIPGCNGHSRITIIRILTEWFSIRQLALIEAALEADVAYCRIYSDIPGTPPRGFFKALDFAPRSPKRLPNEDNTQRALKILRNMAHNRGTFKP